MATVLKIHCVSDFGELEMPWKLLAAASQSATIFQTWEWSAAWWKHNRAGKKLFALRVEDSEGNVIGLAPLFRSAGVLRVVGTGGSDYLDFLALPKREREVAEATARWLQQNTFSLQVV